MKKAILAILLSVATSAFGVERGLSEKDFKKHWTVEAEPGYKLAFRADTLSITSPGGFTLWCKDKMEGNVTIEYDARVMDEGGDDRLSDLNCFWMASDPKAKSVFDRAKQRGGVFNNCYALQLYYLGYGANGNTTTRFRRYTGNEDGVADANARPAVLQEYTDPAHMQRPNQWRHIKIETKDGRTRYYIDGERLVDYYDPEPLTSGWFGFRTTKSRTEITNFKYTQEPIAPSIDTPLHWIGDVPAGDAPVSFGIPFDPGAVKAATPLLLASDSQESIPFDSWPMAYWPDGSVKWMAVSAVIPAGSTNVRVVPAPKSKKIAKAAPMPVTRSGNSIMVDGGEVKVYLTNGGSALLDSITLNGVKVAENLRLACRTQDALAEKGAAGINFKDYASHVDSVAVERVGAVRTQIKLTGTHVAADGASLLPFAVRLFVFGEGAPIKMEHTIIYDGDQNKDFVNALGILVDVPMREANYNRHVAFATADGGVWSEPVQPIVGRRVLKLPGQKDNDPVLQQMQMDGKRVPDYEAFDEANRKHLDNWASWGSFRLSQLSSDGFTIRKRTDADHPWVGTYCGTRAPGYAFAGDLSGGLAVLVRDFWQSYPSSIEITDARSDKATICAWLWSPEAEPMDLRHYDSVAHDLLSSYEDVQEGMSTPYGIARTSELTLIPRAAYTGKADFAADAALYAGSPTMMPTPQCLHDRQAFGIWSLPDRSTPQRAAVEDKLNTYIDFYQKAVEQNRWYGFWHYGDFMHSYDPIRHCWKYDVGGFAWDNTELASNMWLWYNFLRTGRQDIWQMARAMARHTAEVDVYHIGDMAGLGSRHNVSHWGCGAKEARISQAAWNRFYYYLAADERSGELMDEVADADQMLYEIDPMRLAQPRSEYPCTAPARLRIGPDWLAYAGNWMTRWERTQDPKYRDKITAGMKSICALPSRILTGPLALGYDPATGIITTECDSSLQATNHLMTIMGGFEINNELMRMLPDAEWQDAWLDHAKQYKQKALEILRNRFRVSRLQAYAAMWLRSPQLAKECWDDLLTRAEHTLAPEFYVRKIEPPYAPEPLDELNGVSTNDAALWSLDAIYMQEVIPQ